MLQRMVISQFPEIYRIMEDSFSDDEYCPYEEQLALFEEPEYGIYYMPIGSESLESQVPDSALKDKPAGFLAVWEFAEFIFIEHFAVNPKLRNSGTGSGMLQELVKLSKKPVCLEVELPDAELARRRIGFYERNGFVFNDYPYMQPPISKGKSSVPLRIMTYGKAVSQEEFEQIQKILYQRVYKCEPGSFV